MRTETEKLIETCDFISMDTSALMETNALQNFVEKYGPALIKAGRMVFIYKEVLAELKVLSHIDKPVKAYQATLALQILRNNQCLFRLEVSIDEVNVKCRRIADQRIIVAVTWYKVYHTQLFISNDVSLLQAVFTTGQMDAVHGKVVYAARLAHDGDLIRYEEINTVHKQPAKEADDDRIIALNDRYTDGQISGAIFGSLFSAILVGGISCLLLSRSKGTENSVTKNYKRSGTRRRL